MMFKKKIDLNSSYGNNILGSDNARLAKQIADRAIQQQIGADELRHRLRGLFHPDIIEFSCNLVNEFYCRYIKQ